MGSYYIHNILWKKRSKRKFLGCYLVATSINFGRVLVELVGFCFR